MINAKDCKFLDFTVQIFVTPIVCSSGWPGPESGDDKVLICSPENARLQGMGQDDKGAPMPGDPHRVSFAGMRLVHVLFEHPNIETHCLKVAIERTIDCKNGCDPMYMGVSHCWSGSGMMLPPGEYTFSIPEQIAHCAAAEDIDTEVTVTLLLEPAPLEFVQAALYNQTLC